MPRLKIDNNIFYTELNVSKEKIHYEDGYREGTFNQENLIKDIEQEIEENPASNNVPKYQTNSNLYSKMRGKKHWDDLFRKVCHSLMRIYTKPYVLVKSWANIARSNSNYGFHTHIQDLTIVYYLKCNYPEYGTNIENKVIIPAINDSFLIFNGNISHALSNQPYEVAINPNNDRYSIVFDFNIDKNINPDNMYK